MTASRSSNASTIITIACTLIGTVVAYLTLAATVKWPPFQTAGTPETSAGPSPSASPSAVVKVPASVIVFKGESARGQGNCTHMSCAFIAVELKGFPSSAAVRCTFDSSVGPSPFLDLQTKVDTTGSVRAQSTNFFGNPGGWVSATCDGVRGELNPW